MCPTQSRIERSQVIAMDTLAHLVPLYPTLHRSLQSQLSGIALRYLNGSAPKPMSQPLLESASRLYSTLPHTGGKVGAANNWRKSVDDTLAFAWGAFLGLTDTFKSTSSFSSPIGTSERSSFLAGYSQPTPPAATSIEDPIVSVPLSRDRLRAAIAVLTDLLR